MQIPLRLTQVLGTDTSAIDTGKIAALLGWREDTDLDFKETLNRMPEGRRDLVNDVVAMANARGGVLIIGVREEDTQAVELTPLQPSENYEDRTDIYQAVAELVSPLPTFDVQQIEAEGGGYFLVLLVSRSRLAPHAVRRSGTPNLRYPVREGTRTRYLAEPELADRYRDRFRQASVLIERLEQVRGEGEEVLGRSEEPRGWLSLALVPENPGRFDVEMSAPIMMSEWLRELMRDLSPAGGDGHSSIQGGVAFRRVVVGDWKDYRSGGIPLLTHCQFHSDGAGFFGQWCSFPLEADELREYRAPLLRTLPRDVRRVILVTTAEQLFDKLVVGLSALGRHAIDHCGTDGDAVVSASLVPTGMIEATVTASVHILNNMIVGLRQSPDTHELQQSVVSKHTLPLRTIYTPSADMMVVVRLLMRDLLSLFGQAGVAHITEDGSLVPVKFRSDFTPDRTAAWAQRFEIPTV